MDFDRKKLQNVGCTLPNRDTLPIGNWDIIWVTNYYNGPIQGLCLIDGRAAYFNIYEDECDPNDSSKSHVCFTVHPLTDEEVQCERAHQKLFEKYYGTRWSYEIPPEQRFSVPFTDRTQAQYEIEKLLVDQEYTKYGSKVDLQARESGYRDREPIAIMANFYS